MKHFNIETVSRISIDTVMATVTMDVKVWNSFRAKGQLGVLYGVDISNALYREHGVKAYQPSVGDRDRAVKGVKTITLNYHDSDWKHISAEIIHVDFNSRKRIA